MKELSYSVVIRTLGNTGLKYKALLDSIAKQTIHPEEIIVAIPEGYEFIGYDISYPCDYSGSFSIICDCMFICRWHGCDKEGILFLPEFSKLNANGLFDDWQSAYDYMVKYLSEDWTERGEYCILEIFKKLGR